MSYLLIGDLHLSARPRDAYRFNIFKWIKKQQTEFQPKATFIMGDLCDKKDNHPSVLVNRVVEELSKLDETYIPMGNHDYIDPNNPFFNFLNVLPNIHFIVQPTLLFKSVGVIPHCKPESEFVRACRLFQVQLDYLLLHATFEGAIAETGVRLSGYNQSPIEQLKPRLGTYAGDVHRPQRAANVTYVGAPYHIRFGDDFDPRCILLDDNGKPQNLYFETIRKWSLTVRSPDEITKNKQLFKGDQVKLTVELAREETVEWKTHRQLILEAAKAKGLEIFGVDLKINTSKVKKVSIVEAKANSPAEAFSAFCKNENLPSQTKKVGAAILG